MIGAAIGLGVSACVIFLLSLHQTLKGRFYSDTFWLFPWGVYVWGDALVLGPFWFFTAVVWGFMTPVRAFDMYIWFLFVRSGYEVLYWLTHQVANRGYRPPFLRRITILKAQELAIIYQLLHSCVVVMCLWWLWSKGHAC